MSWREMVRSRTLKRKRSEETGARALAAPPPSRKLNRRTNFNIPDVLVLNDFILFVEACIHARIEGVPVFSAEDVLPLNSFWLNELPQAADAGIDQLVMDKRVILVFPDHLREVF